MIAFFIVTLLELDTQDQRMSIFICIAGVAGIFILFFIIIYYVGDLQRSKIHNLMMEQYQIEQQNYYDNMMKRETQTRQFRHDIINHLIELQEFGKRGEYDRMEAYLEHMLNDISIISRSQYDVGNTTINVMLNYYLSQKPENCNVIVDGYVSEYANVADKDLCTIVSNLLKNAIESVSHIAENMTEIRFCISRGEKYLRICVENDVQGAVLFDKNHALVTTKLDKENHGFGLMNVKCVVEKYNGRYRVLCENGKYRVDVTLEIDR
jgi:sensor histidine kinase regulating citrate/malate metabolism